MRIKHLPTAPQEQRNGGRKYIFIHSKSIFQMDEKELAQVIENAVNNFSFNPKKVAE